MTSGSKETRFAEIGAFCVPLGAFQRRLHTLALSDVFDRYHDLAGCLMLPADLLGIQQQHASAERWQFDFDLMILYGGVLRLEQAESAAERRHIQTVVADVSKMLAKRLLRHHGEGTVEGAVGIDDAQLLVEHDQGLAYGVDNAIRPRIGGPGIGKMRRHRHGRAPPNFSPMTSCRHTGLLLSLAPIGPGRR